MEPASTGLTPRRDSVASSAGTLDSLHLTVKSKDPSAEPVVREETPGTFSVLQDAIPPYQAIQDAVKKSTESSMSAITIQAVRIVSLLRWLLCTIKT